LPLGLVSIYSSSLLSAFFSSSGSFFLPFITLGPVYNEAGSVVLLLSFFFSSLGAGFSAGCLVVTGLASFLSSLGLTLVVDALVTGFAAPFLSAGTTYVTPPAFILSFKLYSIGSSSSSFEPFF
jgi:hypothetical protein